MAAKIGVRLDATDQQCGSGGSGVDVLEQRRSIRHDADLLYLHRRAYFSASALGSHAKLRQQQALAFRRRAAVAAHRRNDKRLRANRSQSLDRRSHDRR